MTEMKTLDYVLLGIMIGMALRLLLIPIWAIVMDWLDPVAKRHNEEMARRKKVENQ